MSLNVFLVFCILGDAFMMYALFQWTCGDKRGAHGRQLPARKDTLINQSGRPFLKKTCSWIPRIILRQVCADSSRTDSVQLGLLGRQTEALLKAG